MCVYFTFEWWFFLSPVQLRDKCLVKRQKNHRKQTIATIDLYFSIVYWSMTTNDCFANYLVSKTHMTHTHWAYGDLRAKQCFESTDKNTWRKTSKQSRHKDRDTHGGSETARGEIRTGRSFGIQIDAELIWFGRNCLWSILLGQI